MNADIAFAKIQPPILIKAFQHIELEGKFLSILKAIYEKPTANIILNGEALGGFPLSQEQNRDVHSQNCYSA